MDLKGSLRKTSILTQGMRIKLRSMAAGVPTTACLPEASRFELAPGYFLMPSGDMIFEINFLESCPSIGGAAHGDLQLALNSISC
jgi:hypothetical protein